MASESARKWHGDSKGSYNSAGATAKCEECGRNGKPLSVRMSYRLNPVNFASIRRRLCIRCRLELGFVPETINRPEMLLDDAAKLHRLSSGGDG